MEETNLDNRDSKIHTADCFIQGKLMKRDTDTMRAQGNGHALFLSLTSKTLTTSVSGQSLPVNRLPHELFAFVFRKYKMAPRARSNDFYWETSTFLVEDVLFRVPKSQLIESSETFRAMFTLPQAETGTVEGDTDEEAIQLQGVIKVDFERLLRFMYRRNGAAPLETSHEEWISILKLSTMWEMTEIRTTAISNILERQLKIDATERISLGEKYEVPALVTSGIVALVNQQGGVSEEQTVTLGFEMALRIQCIRMKLLENCLSIQPGQRSIRPPGVFSESNVRTVARDVFHGERSFSEPVKSEAEELELASVEAIRKAVAQLFSHR